jgi:hypothetical protein
MIFNFFTHWGYILLILYYIGLLRRFQYSILLLLILISCGSLFINYINPRYFMIIYKKIKYKLNPPVSLYLDVLMHHLPLIIFLVYYDIKIPRDNLIFAFVIITMYLLLYNPFKVYDITISKKPSSRKNLYNKLINLN